MRNLLLVALLLFTNNSFGQSQKTITTIDFVKIKNDKRLEALFYYENNWKVFRDSALEKGYIKSYKLLSTMFENSLPLLNKKVRLQKLRLTLLSVLFTVLEKHQKGFLKH